MHHIKHGVVNQDRRNPTSQSTFLSSGIQNVSPNKLHMAVCVFYDNKTKHNCNCKIRGQMLSILKQVEVKTHPWRFSWPGMGGIWAWLDFRTLRNEKQKECM